MREFLKFQELATGALAAIRGLPVPVIAAINGAAAGGGMALALSADIRLASPTAKINAAFVKIGLSVGELGTSWTLTRLVGPGRAAEIAFTGRSSDAEEAERIGLVNRVVPAESLLDEAIALALAITANSPGRRADVQARAAGQPGDRLLRRGARAREPRPGAAHARVGHARGARRRSRRSANRCSRADDRVFVTTDDLRHRAPDGGRMRDSLFWNLILPEEELGLQVYTFVNHRGRAGLQRLRLGRRAEPVVLQHIGQVGHDADFDDWNAGRPARPPARAAAHRRGALRQRRRALEYAFEALHEAFSYRQNPGGLPAWFAREPLRAGRPRPRRARGRAAGRSSSTASPTATTPGARATGAPRSTGSGCSPTRRRAGR